MGLINIDTNPSRKTLNQFGLIWMGFLTFFGTIAWFKAGNERVAYIVWALAVIVPVIGWLVPAFMRLVFLGLSYAAFPIGWVVSHVVMAMVYYLIFTPCGLIMRCVGYDPMKRRLKGPKESYWCARPPRDSIDPRSYFRQF